MIRSLIFDMDGTLFQTNKILDISLVDTFDYLRKNDMWSGETPIETYQKIMGVPLPVVWETLMPNHTSTVRTLANDYFHEQLINNIKSGKGDLYPHVFELFDHLKKNNYSIFIASNGLVKYLNVIEKYYKLDRWVTETFSIEQIHTQDKGDLVQLIKQKYKIDNGAVVGDRLSDIHAAKKNGFISIGCNFDFAHADELAKADIIIDDLLEIKDVLPSLETSQTQDNVSLGK
ncbi:HAD hydrolase-like protein [Bacillus sp. FJAT-49732]|uniref:HAD hydrolase-like protein n=1 Tax=Lederbergia citrisecunda TaxID=2833583 RepID=A0A942TN87_9BACI|nr:HAD hydrolase-like protein [Lederbergia citrisecunda]MBS4201360.1 HAD hydrolase-like protein [Lederbergia citrisecunda]